jgi:hypothetical protein
MLATASLFPDLDSLTLLLGREMSIQYHRVFTQALNGWVLGALWMIRVVKRKTSGAATGEGPAESQGVCSPRPNPWVWTGDAGDVRFGTGQHASRRRSLAMCS